MILTTQDRIDRYTAVNPGLAKAFAALKKLASEPEYRIGRHEVDGDALFVNDAQYDTHPRSEARLEAHRRYIDVMWMISGSEELDTCPLEQAGPEQSAYDAQQDFLLTELPSRVTRLQLTAGSVCILFPEDAHAPGITPEGSDAVSVHKLIAKVAL